MADFIESQPCVGVRMAAARYLAGHPRCRLCNLETLCPPLLSLHFRWNHTPEFLNIELLRGLALQVLFNLSLSFEIHSHCETSRTSLLRFVAKQTLTQFDFFARF